MNSKICVLIRAKNEAKDIGKALDLVISQSVSAEVIVVDSGSTDGTVEIVKQYSTVRLIEMPAAEFTFGRSLNLGIAATSADVIVALSAHAFPCDSHWLEHLTQHFTDPQVAGVYGRQVPHSNAYPPVKRDCLDFYGTAPRIQTDPNQLNDRTFSNANSAIRRTYWQEYPFDEALPANEDQDWAWEMLKRNYQIRYEPQASVFHSHNETLSQVFCRTSREAAAALKLTNAKTGLKAAIVIWLFLVASDIRFIIKYRRGYQWILKAPIYRLVSLCARVSCSLQKV